VKKPFEPSQPIAPTFNDAKPPAEERKDPFSFLIDLLPKPAELKAASKSDDIPIKQSYSGDATKAVYVKAPPAPATVYINEPNPVYAVKEDPQPKYQEQAAPPPPPPAYNQNARKDVVEPKQKKEELKPTFGALKKEPFSKSTEDKGDTLVAPREDDDKKPQEKQSYDAPAPSYGAPKPSYGPPPSKPSYAPPKPTYKPKPTYQPKPKPVYNPPPTYAPAPPAPHIIYAGHPPIHIYQQPSVETLPAAPVYEPPATQKPAYNPPPPPAYSPPKQTYQDSAPAASYDAPQPSYAKPDAPTYTPPKKEASYGPPKAPQKTPPKSNYGAPKDNYNAPKPPPSYGAPKKPEYTPPKPAKRPPPPKPSSYGPPPKPSSYNPPPKPQPPAYQPPKQTYQSNSAPVYIPAPKAYHKPPIIIYQGVVPPVHVYEQPAGTEYSSPPAQAKSSNVVELAEWNPSNGPQARSDNEPADSNVVATISVGSSLAGKSQEAPQQQQRQQQQQQPQPQAESGKSLGSIEDIVKALAGDDDNSEAVVSAKVSVEAAEGRSAAAGKSVLTHKGTVEDLAVD
jgi:hypothetical protein